MKHWQNNPAVYTKTYSDEIEFIPGMQMELNIRKLINIINCNTLKEETT